MWQKGWREEIWSRMDGKWDVLIIGGGITGAGVARIAAACGLKTLLVEAKDFAFGTSSRSSKLVHGGFRYIYNLQFQVTFESVRQREELLREAPNLVTPLAFNLPNYKQYNYPSWILNSGVTLYDLMAPKWQHQKVDKQEIRDRFKHLETDGLKTCFRYYDAELDDARLVLRVIREAVSKGATAINYARAEKLLRDSKGTICGAVIRDSAVEGGETREVRAKVVVNASGPWTDDLRADLERTPRLRKQRGSHLIFDRQKLPIPEALTIFHPVDHRAMFALPWEGASLVGTTDLDHDPELERKYDEPFAGQKEIDYILSALKFLFPALNLEQEDIISSFAGLRPIIKSGAATPSKESRAHQVWNEDGLITITGGKLTTFWLMARQTVEAVLAALGKHEKVDKGVRVLDAVEPDLSNALDNDTLRYLNGRHGAETSLLLSGAEKNEMDKIEILPNIWAELRWAARSEGVVHLDDLLLRRIRLGMLLPEGGRHLLPRIRKIVQAELGWSDKRWSKEEKSYQKTWTDYYSPYPGK
jgi:glycerol-3-phosphate dehydrogenase